MKRFLLQKSNFWLLAIAMGFLGQPGWAVAGILYSQPWDGFSNSAFASQTGPGGNVATTYDNFTLGSGGVVNKVTWAGQYLALGADTITGFTLSFYNDLGGGIPGGLISSETIAGNANETSLRIVGGITIYGYSDNITPFSANPATQYWLSIVADLALPTQWGWETGTNGDGQSFQTLFGEGSPQSGDLAFALFGSGLTATPEPGTLTLLGLFLSSFGGLGWMKKRKAASAAA